MNFKLPERMEKTDKMYWLFDEEFSEYPEEQND
jgi:hypothetical protein